MAITRGAHSQALHSEKLVSKPHPAHKLARSSSNRTRKHLEVQTRGRQNSQNQIRRPKQAQHRGGQTDLGLSSVLQSASGPSGVRFRSLPSPTSSISAMSEERNVLTPPMEKEQDHVPPTATAVTTGTNDSPNDLEGVGLPFDGLWDYDKAYDVRFCAHHCETEYLLGPLDARLRPSDFHVMEANRAVDISFPAEGDFEALFREAEVKLRVLREDTEAALDTLFEESRHYPREFQPYSALCQAECMDDLRSQVHAVLDRDCKGEEIVYTLQLKAEWVPQSQIPDPGWVRKSLKKEQSRRDGQSRSLRSRDRHNEG